MPIFAASGCAFANALCVLNESLFNSRCDPGRLRRSGLTPPLPCRLPLELFCLVAPLVLGVRVEGAFLGAVAARLCGWTELLDALPPGLLDDLPPACL